MGDDTAPRVSVLLCVAGARLPRGSLRPRQPRRIWPVAGCLCRGPLNGGGPQEERCRMVA